MFRANIKQSGFSLLWSLAVAALQCYGISGQRSLTRKMRRVYKAHIMKQAASLRFALLFSIVLFASASSPGQSSPGQMTVYFPSATHPQVRMMTVDDVIRLSKAGLSDDVIIQQIKKKGQRFDLSTDQLVQLKSASVSERVIQVMIDPTRDPAPSPIENTGAPAAQQAGQPSRQDSLSSTLPTEVGVYAKQKGKWIEVLPEVVNWKTGGVMKSVATVGVVKGDVNGHVNGANSRNRFAAPIEFLIVTPEG